MFISAFYLQDVLQDLITKLNRKLTAKSITSNNISEKIAYYYSELSMIHPFREGNRGTQKMFMEKVDSKKLLEVTIESVNGTGRSLKRIFEEVIETKHFKSQSEQPYINGKSITSTNVSKNNYDLER